MANTTISVDNGKYTFEIDDNTGAVWCHRGEIRDWMKFDQGSKALISLIHLAVDQEDEIEELKQEIIDLKVWPMCRYW
jgi:hypothetical protein